MGGSTRVHVHATHQLVFVHKDKLLHKLLLVLCTTVQANARVLKESSLPIGLQLAQSPLRAAAGSLPSSATRVITHFARK